MADETYDLNRKLKYSSKYQDNSFTIKYIVQIDPDNDSMQYPKTSQPVIMQKKKYQSNYSDSDKRASQPLIKQNYTDPQQKNNKTRRRNERMKKKLQLNMQEAEIFKNFNQYNSKKMKIRPDNEKDYYMQNNKKDKGGKKNKNDKKLKYQMKNFTSESDQQLQSFHDYLAANQPKITKRPSKSIDNSQQKPKFQAPKMFQLKQQKPFEEKNKKKQIYPPYLNLQDIEDSRDEKENKYFRGTIDFNERVKNYAKIFTKQVEGDLIVEGINKNRCIHGDQVYFQLLPKQQLPADKQKDIMNQKIRCRVVYILPWKTNSKRKIVGKVQYARSNKIFYLVPINKRIISFDIKFSDITQQNLKKMNEKYFIAEFTEWKSTDEFPGCKILSQFGAIGEVEAQTQALLINNGVEDKQYDEETVQKGLEKFLKCADEHGEYKIPEEQIKNRSDLRNDRIFTIDPLTAKDFDDALSIIQIGTGQQGQKIYEIGVHIADASYFVQEGGLIDQRAQQTTTSVYLVHRVLPMLPRVLCETMCSLNPGLQRLTLSVWFKITAEGKILPGSRYDRSVIKSRARFTYQQAQKIIKNQVKSQQDIEPGFGCVKSQDFNQIAQDLRIMNSIAVKVRQARIKGGSLIFETPKKSFKLDQNFKPQSIEVSKRFQAHFLVQEYMLLANQKVGEILVENLGSSALLRRHKFPTDKKIDKFQRFTLKINQPIKINKQTPMQQQMNQVMKNPKIKQCIKDVLNYQMIFLLQQAEYFVVGDIKKQQWLHYALNMPVYTHFTSPIRRYPDIMVHRELIAIIKAKKQAKPKQQIQIPTYKKLKQIVDRCNRNKISAKKVSSGCEKIFLCLYLKTHPVFSKAVLTDLNQYCLSICVPSYDFRSTIEFKQLKNLKPLNFSKDSSERKFVQLRCEYEPGNFTNIILKQMQQIDVKLAAKQGFPIDYVVKLVFPHPKDFNQRLICQ